MIAFLRDISIVEELAKNFRRRDFRSLAGPNVHEAERGAPEGEVACEAIMADGSG